MYKWLQANNKRLLAFIGVFLMVAFLMPSTFRGCDPEGMAMGTMDGHKISSVEVQNALREWEYVRQNVGFLQTDQQGQQQFMPLFAARAFVPLQYADAQIEEHKLLYYLLREEARRTGAAVSPQTLDDILARISVRLPDRRVVMYEDIKNTAQGRGVRQAMNNVLAVAAGYNRTLGDVRVTEPQLQAEMATQFQSIKMKLIDLDSKTYADKVAAPSPESLNEQFQKYADKLPDQPSTKENPFGFGYKFPDRVTLQYISVARDQVRQAVLDNPQNGATPEERAYYWEVEARKHYNANKGLFAATQASTQPTTAPAAPPFEAVKAEALNQVLAPQIDRLARLVQQRIVTAMNNDYTNFAKAGPTTAPATSFGVPYNSFDYLQALSADVQKQFGVIPTLVNLADHPRSAAELAKLEGIRDATAMVQGKSTPFGDYAVAFAEPLAGGSASEREQAFLLKLHQPSQTMTDFGQTFYVFRLTSADKAHRPATLEEVRAQVEYDVKTRLAYEAALADARKILAAAGNGDLALAAEGRKVIDTPELRFGRSFEVPGLVLSTAGQQNMMRQSFDLLAAGDVANPKQLIELPREGHVLVAELTDVRSDVPQEFMAMAEAQQANAVVAQMSQILAASWFDYYNVVDRVNYLEPGAKAPATQPVTAGR